MMKRLNRILTLLFVSAVMVSCSRTEYTDVIPADATFVASVDLNHLSQDANLANSPVVQLLKTFGAEVVDRQLLTTLIDNPSEIGIDFKSPAYVFETKSRMLGLVLSVSDEDKLEELFALLSKKQLVGKLVEKDGCQWSTLLGDIPFAFNDHALVFMAPFADELSATMLKNQLSELLQQSEEQSFTKTEQFDRMSAGDASVRLYSRMSALPSDYAETIAEFLPEGVRAADVEVLSTIAFEKGEAILHASLFSANPQVQQVLEDNDKQMHTISGEFLNAPSEGFFVWFTVGCKGDWLLQRLKSNEQAKQLLFMLERGIDIEKMLKAVDGDFTLIVPNVPASSVPDFLLLAHLDNTDFLKDVDYWQKSASDYGISLVSDGKNQYRLLADGFELDWGVDGKTLYLASSASMIRNAFTPRSSLLQPFADDINQSQLFAYVNASAFDDPTFATMGIKCFQLRQEKTGEMEIRVQMNDDSTNILEQLLNNALKQVIGSMF